jgi:hypothetical protein
LKRWSEETFEALRPLLCGSDFGALQAAAEHFDASRTSSR